MNLLLIYGIMVVLALASTFLLWVKDFDNLKAEKDVRKAFILSSFVPAINGLLIILAALYALHLAKGKDKTLF